jgi:uncharacterized protein YndB with AHSA1/START domain
MKKILLSVVAAILFLIVLVLIMAATKPDTFNVQRSTTIKAPPEKIFGYINDFHNWGAWSPYEKLDPAMKRSISGPAGGKGAVYAWDGNSKAGAGTMEITESTPSSRIVCALHFTKPFEGRSVAEFTLEPQGESTKVTWAMHGPMNFFSKVISVFMSMDGMIGKQFDEGLANMATLAAK